MLAPRRAGPALGPTGASLGRCQFLSVIPLPTMNPVFPNLPTMRPFFLARAGCRKA